MNQFLVLLLTLPAVIIVLIVLCGYLLDEHSKNKTDPAVRFLLRTPPFPPFDHKSELLLTELQALTIQAEIVSTVPNT